MIVILAWLGISLLSLAVVGMVRMQLTPCRNFQETRLLANNKIMIKVALANTNSEWTKGLSGCAFIPGGSGMYFAFGKPSITAFWMKDMLVPIDIVWISNRVVIGVERNIQPPADSNEELRLYRPPRPVDAVLEVAAGEVDRIGISDGWSLGLKSEF